MALWNRSLERKRGPLWEREGLRERKQKGKNPLQGEPRSGPLRVLQAPNMRWTFSLTHLNIPQLNWEVKRNTSCCQLKTNRVWLWAFKSTLVLASNSFREAEKWHSSRSHYVPEFLCFFTWRISHLFGVVCIMFMDVEVEVQTGWLTCSRSCHVELGMAKPVWLQGPHSIYKAPFRLFHTVFIRCLWNTIP